MTTRNKRLEGHAVHRRSEEDARAPQFWTMEIDTRHFSFEAYSLSEAGCRDAMRRALTAHAAACIPQMQPGPLTDAWIDSTMMDAAPKRRFMGEGYRDGSCMTGGK